MNIKILDSWLREYLKTDATPKQFAEHLSLTSAGVERVEKHGNDFLYDIEITTNRPDLASVIGLAREASAILPQAGFTAEFLPPKLKKPHTTLKNPVKLTIKNHDELVPRTLAVVMEVTLGKSPKHIAERLEATDIRSLNNLIDVTNYVMRTIGYPTHVMDYDRIQGQTLIIREAKPEEGITTLDGKTYALPGGDIVAEDNSGEIVDLLGIMGLQKSVVTNDTKRILFFINNDNPQHIRKTSMHLGIRTEAAQLNEKGLDPELAHDALLFGIALFEDLADGKVVSEIIDIYPQKPKSKTVSVTEQQINTVMGVTVSLKRSAEILKKLGFHVTVHNDSLTAEVPSFRLEDISIPEDLIEEIARVYGYHTIPNALPPISTEQPSPVEDAFYWESRVKRAMKYWGFTEAYTYPLVSEAMYEGELTDAVKLKNPLGEEFAYMRVSLIPSLLKVIAENKKHETIKLFEIANIYEKNGTHLPNQKQRLAGVMKQKHASFFQMKGIIEQLAADLGITGLTFQALSASGIETEMLIGKKHLGTLEMLDESIIDFELDFDMLISHASNQKVFIPLQKYPPVIEDISVILNESIPTGDVIETIRGVSDLVTHVSLLDKYESSRTFHIMYQSDKRNLTTIEIGEIRKKILTRLSERHGAKLKS